VFFKDVWDVLEWFGLRLVKAVYQDVQISLIHISIDMDWLPGLDNGWYRSTREYQRDDRQPIWRIQVLALLILGQGIRDFQLLHAFRS